MNYQLLIYRIKTRKKLIIRFRSYLKLAKWVDKNIKQEDFKYYKICKTYNIR